MNAAMIAWCVVNAVTLVLMGYTAWNLRRASILRRRAEALLAELVHRRPGDPR